MVIISACIQQKISVAKSLYVYFESKDKYMKKKIIIGIFGLAVAFVSCETLGDLGVSLPTTTGGSTGLTQSEIVQGLKSALEVGASNSSASASKMDGFMKNPKIKLPFPPSAQNVKEKVESIPGGQAKVDEFVLTLNRAAEDAAIAAKPIFIDAVKGMTVQDGLAILQGGDHAATDYLKEKTSASLREAFMPKIKESIGKVKLTDKWEPVAKAYNTAMMFTGGEAVDPDLNNYVCDKAMSGLFTLIAEEEEKIRENPAARVNDILKKVFGSPEANGGSGN